MSETPKAKVTTLNKKQMVEAEEARKEQEVQAALELETISEHNRVTIEANQRAAKEWIDMNKGRGVLLGMNGDGTFHTFVVGNADRITDYEPHVDSNLFDMIMLLVGTHLPGSSLASQGYHADLATRLGEVSAKLGILLNNQGALVSFLQMKFPELQVSKVDAEGKPVNSGLIIP